MPLFGNIGSSEFDLYSPPVQRKKSFAASGGWRTWAKSSLNPNASRCCRMRSVADYTAGWPVRLSAHF